VWFNGEPHGVTSQMTVFFIITAVKTSNLTKEYAVWFNGEPHGVISQKTAFFMVTAVKTSNLNKRRLTLLSAYLLVSLRFLPNFYDISACKRGIFHLAVQ
jgi:hypothetical protein